MLNPVRQTDRQGANSSSTSLHNIKGLVLSRETSQVITFTKSMLTVSIDIDHCLSACLPIHATLYYMISEVLTPKEDELLSYRLSKLMFQRSLWWGTLKNQFSSFFSYDPPPPPRSHWSDNEIYYSLPHGTIKYRETAWKLNV